MNQNRIIHNGFSSEESRALFLVMLADPKRKVEVDAGMCCGYCSESCPIGRPDPEKWFLCVNARSRHFGETLPYEFICPKQKHMDDDRFFDDDDVPG